MMNHDINEKGQSLLKLMLFFLTIIVILWNGLGKRIQSVLPFQPTVMLISIAKTKYSIILCVEFISYNLLSGILVFLTEELKKGSQVLDLLSPPQNLFLSA